MADELIHQGRFLGYYRRGGWEFVKRANASAVVAIAACTDDGEVVLVEQHRLPLGTDGQRTIELPAGLVGDDGDHDLVAAAQRELVEETGFEAAELAVPRSGSGRAASSGPGAAELAVVTTGPSSAGLTDELITFVVARGLSRVGPGGGVAGEDITVHLVPRDAVDEWLLARAADGLLIDPKVWAGLYLVDQC